MKAYHGNADELVLHPGFCVTEDEGIAADYGTYASSSEGRVHTVELDLDGLTVVELDEGHDWDANVAPGDNGETYADEDGNAADVIIFADATAYGREHETYRLMTPAALAAVTLISTSVID